MGFLTNRVSRRAVAIAFGAILSAAVAAGARQGGPASIRFGSVSGRILSPDGTPAAGVRVTAITATPANGLGPPENDALMSLDQTDADGHYRLESILPGSYYIMVGPLDAPIYFPGVAAQSNATILAVTAGANLAASDFRLTRPLAVRVSGRVIRDGHRAGNQVILTRNRLTFNATIAPDGSFTFPAVQPGIYQARVTPGVNALPPITVVVADSEITGLELPIPLSAVDIVVNITVTMEGGGTIPRFQLQFMPAGPLPANLSSTVPVNFATNGRSEAILGASTQRIFPQQAFPQTEYRVRVSPTLNPLPAGYVVKSITVDSVDVMNRPFKISAAEPTNLAIALSVGETTPWVTLRGHVTGIAASPVAATSISLQGNGLTGAGSLQSSVNSDGSFEIPKVLPGAYQVRLTPAADSFTRTIVVDRANPDIEIPMQIPALKVSGRTTGETQLKRTGSFRQINSSGQRFDPSLGKIWRVAFQALLWTRMAISRSRWFRLVDMWRPSPSAIPTCARRPGALILRSIRTSMACSCP